MITTDEMKTMQQYVAIFKANANSELKVPRSILKVDLKKAVEIMERLMTEFPSYEVPKDVVSSYQHLITGE